MYCFMTYHFASLDAFIDDADIDDWVGAEGVDITAYAFDDTGDF